MISVLGDEYIAQHVINTYRKELEEKRYMTYIADALYVISSRDKTVTKRYSEVYADVFIPTNIENEEETAENIKQSMLKKLNEGRKRTDGLNVSSGEIEP